MASDKSTAATLIEVAIPLFVAQPFDAVSTRQIAKRAGVNLSAISYHFGSKEGLYTAIFERIIEDLAPVRGDLAVLVDSQIHLLPGNPSQQRLFFKDFVDLILGAILSQNHPAWRMHLILREIQSRGPNFDLVLQGHVDKIQDLMCRSVAAIVGEDVGSVYVVLTSQSIMSLCLQYGLNQELIKLRLGLRILKAPEIELIKKITTSHIIGMLGLTDRADPK